MDLSQNLPNNVKNQHYKRSTRSYVSLNRRLTEKFDNLLIHQKSNSTPNESLNSSASSLKGRPFHVPDCYVDLPSGKKYLAINILTTHQPIILVIDEKHTDCQMVLVHTCSLIGLNQTEYFGLAQLVYFESGIEYKFLEAHDRVIYQTANSTSNWLSTATRSFRNVNKNAGMSCNESIHPGIRQPSSQLYLRVKYYVDLPSAPLINDHVALTHYYMQMKENYLKSCQVWDESKCFILAAYAYLSEHEGLSQKFDIAHLNGDQFNDSAQNGLLTNKNDTDIKYSDLVQPIARFDCNNYLPKWIIRSRGEEFCHHTIPLICRDIVSHNTSQPGSLNSSVSSKRQQVNSFVKDGPQNLKGNAIVTSSPIIQRPKTINNIKVTDSMLMFCALTSGFQDPFCDERGPLNNTAFLHHCSVLAFSDTASYANVNNNSLNGTILETMNKSSKNMARRYGNNIDNSSSRTTSLMDSCWKRDCHNMHIYKLHKKPTHNYGRLYDRSQSQQPNKGNHLPRKSFSTSNLKRHISRLHNQMVCGNGNDNNSSNLKTNAAIIENASPHHFKESHSFANLPAVKNGLPNGEMSNTSSHITNTTAKSSQYADHDVLWLGISNRGIHFYEDNGQLPRLPLSIFKWEDIEKLSFEKDKFEIKRVNDYNKFSYYAGTAERASYLLNLCKSTHMFQLKHRNVSLQQTPLVQNLYNSNNNNLTEKKYENNTINKNVNNSSHQKNHVINNKNDNIFKAISSIKATTSTNQP